MTQCHMSEASIQVILAWERRGRASSAGLEPLVRAPEADSQDGASAKATEVDSLRDWRTLFQPGQ